MTRLRYNNIGGTIQAALSSTDTTITFSSGSPPPFPTIVAPDYVPIVINPPFGVTPSATFEIVHLTAYTAGAATGTIQRGQEGTVAAAHTLGAAWGISPLAQDFAATTLLASITLGANGAIDLTSIPTNYNDLLLVALLRSPRAATGSTVGVRFNNDSGANYAYQNMTGAGSTAAAAGGTGQTSTAQMAIAAASALAGLFSIYRLEVPGYASANPKMCVATGAVVDPTASAIVGVSGGVWNSGSPISRLTLWDVTAAAGTFVAGSTVRLYGRM